MTQLLTLRQAGAVIGAPHEILRELLGADLLRGTLKGNTWYVNLAHIPNTTELRDMFDDLLVQTAKKAIEAAKRVETEAEAVRMDCQTLAEDVAAALGDDLEMIDTGRGPLAQATSDLRMLGKELKLLHKLRREFAR